MTPIPVLSKNQIDSSSDGNQIKFRKNNRWYKVDSEGYEGLAETLTSMILQSTNVESYALYREEQFFHNGKIKLGCSSENFLPNGCSLITTARLFKQAYGESPSIVCKDSSLEGRILKFVEMTANLTKLSIDDVGYYLTQMFEVDSFILNKDRHFNNIAFIRCNDTYMPAPLFDHGDSFLLADYTSGELESRIEKIVAKPFLISHNEQIEIMENNFGQNLFFVKEINIDKNKLSFYQEDVVRDALDVLNFQYNLYRNKYSKENHKLNVSEYEFYDRT